MARLVPDIDPALIENSGEKDFYEAVRELPGSFNVYYRYKFSTGETVKSLEKVFEADFVIVHPRLGYVVVEVKGGHFRYTGNRWQRQDGGEYVDYGKDPAEQAERAMFNILQKYKQEAGRDYFPLKIRYAVCFPDCHQLAGRTPDNLKPESIWLCSDLEDLERKIRAVFNEEESRAEDQAVALLDKVLAPSFAVFSDLESQMQMFHSTSEKVLTEEQERILDETVYDRRKIFFGAASTGKTFIAMEKVRRLTGEGKKVLLTCFNRNLGKMLRRELADEVNTGQLVATNFHDLLMHLVRERGEQVAVPEEAGERAVFFRDELPELAFQHIADLAEDEKYDALVVDEGQDFREEWFFTLQGLLKGGEQGEFYIFADPAQSLFNTDSDAFATFDVSRHRLTLNLRNTEEINKWLTRLRSGHELKCKHRGGIPVGFFPWENAGEEPRLAGRELGRLVSQNVRPGRVVILSPRTMENSPFAGQDRVGKWPLVDARAVAEGGSDPPANAVRFYTIRSFKGLEADIVFLTGIRTGLQACTPGDIYVGCSRARFLLYVFHEAGFVFLKSGN